MARGWESKSIEEQQSAAERTHASSEQVEAAEKQIRRQRERESIELTRARVLADLQATKHCGRREQLEGALAHLERELEKLGS